MADAHPFDRLCVVLVATRNPLNIGAVARAMCNFGFPDLRVVHPHDAAFREARSAVGAASVLESAREFATVADAVADCSLVVATAAVMGRRELHHPLKTPAGAAPLILAELQGTGERRVAILFGSEKTGLSNQALSHCHWRMYIPTQPEQPSMNLGQAVAVCLYELTRNSSDTSVEESFAEARPVPAASADLERLTSILLEVLDASGYREQHGSADFEGRLRRLVWRMGLSDEDTHAWLGMLRQIAWKLGPGKEQR